ncbi:hypothetical protein ACEQ8H_001494 [Pleosporales sp. CAS-2024a]
MRLTRAAQRAQQPVDEPVADATETTERSPLNDITPNASPEHVDSSDEAPKKPLARSKSKKGAKKGAKAKKGQAAEDEEQPRVENEQLPADDAPEVAAVPPVAEAPAKDEAPSTSVDERPASPARKAVRLTRRQLAKQEEELRQLQRAPSPPRQPEIASATDHVAQSPVDEAQEDRDSAAKEEEPVPELAEAQAPATPEEQLQQVEKIESETVAPSVEVTLEVEPKTLAAEKPSDAATTPTMSCTPSRRTSRSPSKSPMRIEESIEALDALEEALENVGKAVSHFDASNDDKSPRKKLFSKDATTPSARTKTPRKPPMASKVSRTPSAAPKSMKPTTTVLARASSVRVAPAQHVRKASTDTVDYLASKRRPVSVSFPTPPPPPKGRAPTKPAFQLSSDAVAAKLKVQKEERLKRIAEREAQGAPIKQRPMSMAPAVKSTKEPTKANFQLPGEAIAAKLKAQKEERLKREAGNTQADGPKPRPASISMAAPVVKSTKPPTKANFQLPGEAIAARLKAQREERQKREEEAKAAKKTAAASKARTGPVRKPIVLPTRTQPGVTIPPPPPPPPAPKSETLQYAPQRSASLTSKRSSVQLSVSRSASISTNASTHSSSLVVSKSSTAPVDAVQQKIKKGKQVFHRDHQMDQEAKDAERRDKEEAAKLARAQAAERGRIASREWAEKQRKKMMMDAVRSKPEAV